MTMEPVYYSDEEYQQILSILEDLSNQAENLPYPEAKELTTSLLQHFDLVHREAIARICDYLEKNAPQHFSKLKSDFSINTLLKLYDLVDGDLDAKETAKAHFVSVDDLKILSPIVKWEELCDLREIQSGTIYKKSVRGNEIIFALMDNEIFAMKNECVDSILPLDQGTLEYNYIVCPWHGCRYDISNGEMLDKPHVKQVTFETRTDDLGSIEIKIPIADR